MVLILQMGDGFAAFLQNVFFPGIQLLPEIRRLPFIHEGLVVAGPVVNIDKYIHETTLRQSVARACSKLGLLRQ